MIISCPECGVKYRIDENAIGDAPKKIKCAKCGHLFTVQPPEMESTHIADGGQQDTTKVVKSDEILEEINRSVMEGGKRYSLAILSGPLAGQVFPLQKRVTIIGRAFGDIVLPDSEASRKHCQVEVRPEGVYLSDLGSTNGTYVDGKAIQEIELEDKGEFVAGGTSIMLIISSEA